MYSSNICNAFPGKNKLNLKHDYLNGILLPNSICATLVGPVRSFTILLCLAFFVHPSCPRSTIVVVVPSSLPENNS